MHLTRKCLSCLLAILGAASPGFAEVMTFSGLSPTPLFQPTYTEGNITAASDGGVFWGYPEGGVLHFDAVDIGNNAFTFTYAEGAFDLLSFEIPYYFPDSAGVVSARNAAGIVVASRRLDFSSGIMIFAGWTGISSVTIDDRGNHFSIDNFTVGRSTGPALPEPATWAMMLGGFAVAGAWMRRRQPLVLIYA